MSEPIATRRPPVLTVRRSAERGLADHGWLQSRHSFSFGDYHDPRHMGFRSLRVVNEDRVAGGAGFPPHGHRDMEILSYVLEGALAHRDSTGGAGVIRPGELQRMTAGAGVRHSEYNASSSEPVHFLQIWLLPGATGQIPGYEQAALPAAAVGETRLDLVAAPGGAGGALILNADARLSRAILAPGGAIRFPMKGGGAWVQVARGAAFVGDLPVEQGDGVSIEGGLGIMLRSDIGAELLAFDLP